MAPPTEQGYPAFKLTDSNNAECFVVPSYGGAPGAGTQACPVYIARLAVTSAQLLALKTTPLQMTFVAPAAASNNKWVIVPLCISMHYSFLTAAYTLNAGTLKLYYGIVTNANPICADQAALITNTASEVNPNILTTSVGVVTEANGLAQNIYLGNAGSANFTVGAGTLVVALTYNIVSL